MKKAALIHVYCILKGFLIVLLELLITKYNKYVEEELVI